MYQVIFFFLLLLIFLHPSEPTEIIDAAKNNIFPCISYDPNVGHRRTPNCEGWGTRSDRRVLLHYNSMGLRDKEYSPKPARNTVRILFLGSSNISGPGLSDEKTIPRQLEKKLRAATGFKIEVINAATDAYYTTQTAIKLRHYLHTYTPDIIIYNLSSRNGIFFDGAFEKFIEYSDSIPKKLVRNPAELNFIPTFISNWLSSSENRMFLAYSILEQFLRANFSWQLSMPWLSHEQQAKIFLGATVKMLEYMQSTSEGLRIPFVFIWNKSSIDNAQHVPPRMNFNLAKFFQNHLIRPVTIDSINVETVLKKSGVKMIEIWEPRLAFQQYKLVNDLHWNEKGAALFTERLSEKFIPIVKALAQKPKKRK